MSWFICKGSVEARGTKSKRKLQNESFLPSTGFGANRLSKYEWNQPSYTPRKYPVLAKV